MIPEGPHGHVDDTKGLVYAVVFVGFLGRVMVNDFVEVVVA
jgi:hypothetical protein